MPSVSSVTGTPTRAWVFQSMVMPHLRAASTTMMLAIEPTMSRLPASVLTGIEARVAELAKLGAYLWMCCNRDNQDADRRITVELDKKAREWVAEKGYDPVYGARPLRRFLQKHLENQLARALISGTVKENSTLTFRVKNDELELKA